MSDASESDESNFGALLFGDGAEDAPPEYPLETLMVERGANMREGTTNTNFQPLYRRFDSLTVSSDDGSNDNDGKSVGVQLEELSGRIDALQPAPLAVHFRNKHHSLWGHQLWNAAKYLAKRMDQRCIDVRGKTVLELGAGLGVPSLVAYRNGARVVVVTDYPDEDLLDVIQINVDANCTPGSIDADVLAELAEGNNSSNNGDNTIPVPPVAVVEPLLWGKQEHIDQAMRHTAGHGFDIVILSDILFNHVCNDDLIETLVQTLSSTNREAAGYCVFSHHRAFKQLQDFEFFDKCVAHGLAWEQVDEEAYPMMFAEDRGPAAVRMPVKCYKITRRHDRVGGPLDLRIVFNNYKKSAAAAANGEDDDDDTTAAKEASSSDDEKKKALDAAAAAVLADADSAFGKPRFDVVIQGTGVVQSLVSAALARSGLKVLHCDGESTYGGASATLDVRQFLSYLDRLEGRGGGGTNSEEEKEVACARGDASSAHLYRRPRVPGTEHPNVIINNTGGGGGGERYSIDLLPASFMAGGSLLGQLVASDMVRSLEFYHLGGFFFIEETQSDKGNNGGVAVAKNKLVSVPLTRSEVFATNAVSLLEKRRLMQFVKDVEASLVEQFHAKSASQGDSRALARAAAAAAAAEAATSFSKELEGNPSLTLSELLSRKYNLSGRALDIITLMGQLDLSSSGGGVSSEEDAGGGAPLLQSVDLVRQLLTSVGAFGGATPFLVPAYGASELPQSACRTAAVWGTVYVLQRGISRVIIDEATEVQYAVLTNGQVVPTRVIVAPQELLRPVRTTSGGAGGDNNGNGKKSNNKMVLPVRLTGWKNVLALEQRRSDGCLDEGLTSDELAAMAADETANVQLSRVVVVARRPLITAADLRAAAKANDNSDNNTSGGWNATVDGDAAVPCVVALMRVPSSSTSTTATATATKDNSKGHSSPAAAAPTVHLAQQSAATDQVMPRTSQHAILHFTANARELSQTALEQFVSDRFLSSSSSSSEAVLSLDRERDVVLFAGFMLSSLQVAIDSIYGDDRTGTTNANINTGIDADEAAMLIVDVPSPTRLSDAFAIAECEKLAAAAENGLRRMLHRSNGGNDNSSHVNDDEDDGDDEKKNDDGTAEPTTTTATDEEAAATTSSSSPFLKLVGVPTLPSRGGILNDGQAMADAKAAYQSVIDMIFGGDAVHGDGGLSEEQRSAKFMFLEKPPARA